MEAEVTIDCKKQKKHKSSEGDGNYSHNKKMNYSSHLERQENQELDKSLETSTSEYSSDEDIDNPKFQSSKSMVTYSKQNKKLGEMSISKFDGKNGIGGFRNHVGKTIKY